MKNQNYRRSGRNIKNCGRLSIHTVLYAADSWLASASIQQCVKGTPVQCSGSGAGVVPIIMGAWHFWARALFTHEASKLRTPVLPNILGSDVYFLVIFTSDRSAIPTLSWLIDSWDWNDLAHPVAGWEPCNIHGLGCVSRVGSYTSAAAPPLLQYGYHVAHLGYLSLNTPRVTCS